MPIPLGPTIAAGGDILSTGINAVLTSEQNRKNREFAQQQANEQRSYALADYHMQNEYNSPASQMERLKAAGLNPNLVYGNGATATGGNVRASAPAQYEGKAPQLQGNAVGKYLQAQMMTLQSDNLKAQNSVLLAQKKNIDADTDNKIFGAQNKEFDFNYKTDTRNQSLYALQQKNINAHRQGNLTSSQIANTLERTKTEVATRQPRINAIAQSMSESAQRILSMKMQSAKSEAEISYLQTQLINAEKDGRLKEVDIKIRELEKNLKSKGLTWNDPVYIRQLNSLIEAIIK